MQLLVISLIQSAAAMNCGTSGQLDALAGRGTPLDHARLERPAFIHGPEPHRPPPPDRSVYGTSWPDHVETEHFTIQWWDDSVSPGAVTAAAEALEVGWQAFVEEQGWQAPVSSDTYYIWVLLDPALGSTTGYTTEYFDATYPDGLPVIYLNPTTLDDFGPAFYHALTVHELMHAIQFGMRPYDWEADNHNLENWYWEASATHASELADPSIDGHQYTSAWYADRPEQRYDSYDSSHQYGMFVFNAWLDHHLGAGSMRQVWAQSSSRQSTPWPSIMEETTGWSAEALWAGFTDAYGNGTLPENPLYTQPKNQGALEDGAGGRLDELGTHYWTLDGDWTVTPDSGAVILGGTTEAGAPLRSGGSRVVTVTALADGTDYTLSLSEPTQDPDDSGTPANDSGTPPSGGTLPANTHKGGCATVGTGTAFLAWAGLAALGCRRRPRV